MNLDAIPLFTAIRSRLGYVNQRERVIAQNVANADTPGYAPRDLKPFTVDAQKGGPLGLVTPTKTSPMHLTPPRSAGAAGAWATVVGADSETTLDGNKVVLEDQMAKMTESRMDYEAAIGFYQKSLDLLRLAAKPPGRG
jgi:flagellar basal-body rod protein FlgB